MQREEAGDKLKITAIGEGMEQEVGLGQTNAPTQNSGRVPDAPIGTQNSVRGLLYVGVAVFFFSTSPVLATWAEPLSPYEKTFGRMLLAAFVINLLRVWRGEPLPSRAALPRFIGYGLVAAMHFLLYIASLNFTTAAHALAIVYTAPICYNNCWHYSDVAVACLINMEVAAAQLNSRPFRGRFEVGAVMGRTHLILIGPSGTGKTSVAAQLATRLGWRWIDTDEQVEQQAGRSVAAIFRELGEPAFRLMESGAVARACQSETPTVIAVGGGAVLDLTNRALLREHGRTFYLQSNPQDILDRLRRETDTNGLPSRPLLAGSDPLRRITAQINARHSLYNELAETVISTANLDAVGVADEIVAYLEQHPADNISMDDWWVFPTFGTVQNQKAQQKLIMQQNISKDEMKAIAEETVRGEAGFRIIVDEGVWPSVKNTVTLPKGESAVDHYILPAGEAAKSAAQLAAIYDWLAETKTERDDIVVAIGGGATGDLAGYAAATYLRGLRVVQVPTTLLAMVDSAIGGKTAINLAAGKNLVGAFHQPYHIIIDPTWLASLPARDYTAGWGEICKYAMIEASIGVGNITLLPLLEQRADALAQSPEVAPQILRRVITRSAALKAGVVAADEREREGGRRVLLNYGHTLAHALEKVCGYDNRLRHGEAVAIGMTAAATIAERMRVCEPTLLARQCALLRAFALPLGFKHLDVDVEAVIAAISSDKKAKSQRTRWVLPTTPGRVELRADVPRELAAAVIAELGAK